MTSTTVQQYPALITSEHADKPNFMAMVQATAQPFADLQDLLAQYTSLYNINTAVGAQLDVLGEWLGATRQLAYPLTGIFFSFDTDGLGFDQGQWLGPASTTEGLITLDDDDFRVLLFMRILNNHWDGTVPSAYSLANLIFGPLNYNLFIQDYGDLSFSLGLIPIPPPPEPLTALNPSTGLVEPVMARNPATGLLEQVMARPAALGPPSVVVRALLNSGAFDIKPATIRIFSYFTPSATGPVFAFDMQNASFDGFDGGSWAAEVVNNPPDPGQWIFAFDESNFPFAGFDIGNWAT